MKQLTFFIIYFGVSFFVRVQGGGDDSVENVEFNTNAKTTFGIFNATFSWKIQNLHMHDFGTRYTVKPLNSPNLTAIDEHNDATYVCTLTILPEYRYNRIHYNDMDEFDNFELVKYQISANFSVTPVKTDFQYFINEKVYESSMIEKSELKPEDTLMIIVKASFRTKNEFTKV